MPRSAKKKPEKKRGYHHGDLRAALLKAAREVLIKEGAAGLSLREVARRAGVTHAAPYRHFADKEALVAAIAEEGFCALDAAMRARSEAAGPSSLERLVATGLGYVAFARAHSDHYRVMFGAEIASWDEHAELKSAADRAMATLVEHVVKAQAAGEVREGDPTGFASAAWALTHGLAMGLIDGIFAGALKLDPAAAEGFVRAALYKLMQGFVPRQ